MKDLLLLLANQYLFLFEEKNFKIKDSLCDESFGGNAIIYLESENTILIFIKDRGQFFLDFCHVKDSLKNTYSLDLILYLIGVHEIRNLNKESLIKSTIKNNTPSLLENNISTINSLFSLSNWPHTKEKLNELQKIRSKKMFG